MPDTPHIVRAENWEHGAAIDGPRQPGRFYLTANRAWSAWRQKAHGFGSLAAAEDAARTAERMRGDTIECLPADAVEAQP